MDGSSFIRMPYATYKWVHTACKEWGTCIFYRA